MDKLLDNVKKELKQIEDQGLNLNNLQQAAHLVQMYHHLSEEERDGQGEHNMKYMDNYGTYDRSGRGRVDYMYENDRDYWNDMRYPHYGRKVYYGNDRLNEHVNRVIDGAAMYQEGRDRYRDGGSQQRVYDGLEKLMYAVCTLVESTMDFAETPEEKEIIRKHIQKIKNI